MQWYSNVDNFKAANGYEVDGIWYPRVTSILSIKAKPALYMYYANLPSYKVGEAIKTRSAEEGTLVHETIEAILRKEPVVVPDPIKPSIEAFMAFASQHDIVPLKIEEQVVSKQHGYAGTIDVLAKVDGQMGVLDIKTSKGIYRDYGMQTAAYVEAFREYPDIPPLTSWIIRIDQARTCEWCGSKMREKGGNVKVSGKKNTCEHKWSDMQGEFEFKHIEGLEHNVKAFLAAKTLWEWENHDWLKKI
ncbi:MAG: hypothetical protein AAB864_00405 [Patescibacteria group bacterium]